MKKALFVATNTRFFTNFETSDIKILQKSGYEVHTASNVNIINSSNSFEKLNSIGVIQHQMDCVRSPFSLSNIKAYKQLKKILKNENFELIHCHTPVGGILARLAAKKYKNTKIIYTAHGFHFFHGNSALKNLIFHAIEKYFAKFTDVLITINNEDFQAAKKFKLRKNGFLHKINGVGIDTERYSSMNVDIAKKRNELGINENNVMLLSVGELNENKNHETVIKALGLLNAENVHYFIAGVGEKKDSLLDLAKELNIADRVHLIGFRKDIIELCKTADIFVFPSFREGLSVALMEAMSCGLPVIASQIRGNVDLVQDNEGGILVSPYSEIEFKNAVARYLENPSIFKEYGKNNLNVIKSYDIKNVSTSMSKIYLQIQ